jgi:hypothetical protein
MSCDERFVDSNSTCNEQESWGCDCSGCECDGCASEVVLYEGATSGYGADLDVIIEQDVWDAGYTLALSFTMPDDLSAIGSWDGMLGNDDGNHPYPYFNQDGLWFEIQNGPHPNEGGLSLDRFTGGESYTVIIKHWIDEKIDCFSMYIDGTTDATDWCYDYTYSSTPLYAGCGYGKESETFSGSVTRVTLDTHSCDDNDHGDDCPATCFGGTCDAWIESGEAGSCEDIETWEMGDGSYCDCSGCNCGNTPSPSPFPTYSPTSVS